MSLKVIHMSVSNVDTLCNLNIVAQYLSGISICKSIGDRGYLVLRRHSQDMFNSA
jgi:hypothetical protein